MYSIYCIRIDFAGYNLDGTTAANFVTEPMYIPIKLINNPTKTIQIN